MGGVGVSRARRVRCGAVLSSSRLLPSSSAAFVCRRSLPPRVRGRALTFHTFSSCSVRPPSYRRPCLLVPARLPCPSAVTVVKQPRPLPSRVPAVPVAVTAARHSCKCCGARLYVVSFLPFARLREIRRGPPSPRLPPLHLSVVVLRRLRALPFPSLYVTCVYFSTAVKR